MPHQLTTLGMRTLAVACAALLVAGCSSDDGHPVPGSEETAWIDFYIERAASGQSPSGTDASAEQIAILERGRDQGELTMADALEAINNTAACLEDRGLRLTMYPPQVDMAGFESPAYSWGGPLSIPPEEVAAIGDPCLDAESYFVEQAYVTQPRAIALSDAFFDEHQRSTMVACLERIGADFDPDASPKELHDIAGSVALEMYLEGYESEEIDASGRNCIYETFTRPLENPQDE